MTENKTMTLEEQVAALQEQINFLMESRTKSPAKRLENIRRECRTRYFGTFEDMKNGNADYGAEGKNYSDYSAIMDIVRKSTDMLYRYSIGRPNHGTAVSLLITSEDGMKAYEAICEDVCRSLRSQIDQITKENVGEPEILFLPYIGTAS